ncbi:unnamed protein product, partial [Meganyctiphanes norvegica]
MTGSSQSREALSMEMSNSAAGVSFGKKNGCYVNRSVAVLLGVLFISAMAATGLLVYYYAPQVRESTGLGVPDGPSQSGTSYNPVVPAQIKIVPTTTEAPPSTTEV